MNIFEGGNFNKFTVIKNEDIEKYVPGTEKEMIQSACDHISIGRMNDGRKVANTYLVINTDEPYAAEVVEILKRNGHWGPDSNYESKQAAETKQQMIENVSHSVNLFLRGRD